MQGRVAAMEANSGRYREQWRWSDSQQRVQEVEEECNAEVEVEKKGSRFSKMGRLVPGKPDPSA